jgi:hypothetical protein
MNVRPNLDATLMIIIIYFAAVGKTGPDNDPYHPAPTSGKRRPRTGAVDAPPQAPHFSTPMPVYR